MKNKPELLAPAGNIESFFAAVNNGADAVYLGLKKFSARATAPNFTLDELATIVPFAHARGVRIFVALNSLIAASEIPEVLDSLHALSKIGPDALIVQDAAVFYLAKRYFPNLRLHASTLTAVHNSAGVNALARMGADRIVLARELSLSEIKSICDTTKAELEIFIHGALCYSYSGLCLTSSYRGGRSGLRGECVQPCRLKFRQGKKEGFFLSCNDLCALPMIPRLKALRIAGFKIEGRMKPAAYIGLVVKAYRSVIDAAPGEEDQAIASAREMLSQAPSRQLTLGHLGEGTPSSVLTPHRSGSSGIWAGTVKSIRGDRILVDLRHGIEKGDRFRPESSSGREEEAFTANALFSADGAQISSGAAGSQILLAGPKSISAGDRLFKIGSVSEPPASVWRKIREEVTAPARYKTRFPAVDKVLDDLRQSAAGGQREREKLILKVGSIDDLVKGVQSSATYVFISGTRGNLERMAKQRFSGVQMKKIGISLPPLLSEEKDVGYYRPAVNWFLGKGLRVFEINNWGHFDFFRGVEDVQLFAGSRLNIRNEAALSAVSELGCNLSTLSLEVTKNELDILGRSPFGARTIVTLLAWPPLFISRLIPELAEDKPFVTPRGDVYQLKKQAGKALIFADRPIAWFEELPFLRSAGFRSFLIDVSEGPGRLPNALENALSSFSSGRFQGQYSRCNFDRMCSSPRRP
ncbi:MAG: peptidase U32 family protein [Syntrophobacter sp.]